MKKMDTDKVDCQECEYCENFDRDSECWHPGNWCEATRSWYFQPFFLNKYNDCAWYKQREGNK